MKKYTAIYFNKTAQIASKFLKTKIVTIQFFQRHDKTVLCGINEVLDLLKTHTDVTKYKIKYLKEGTIINNLDVVLELEGHYQYFGIYEGVIDGILTRATSLATNARRIVEVTKKEVIFMGDRADHYLNQEHDGYAISVGGIKTQVTDAQVALHNGKAVGTIPHVLIQMFKGDITKSLAAYKKVFPNEKLVALVDFNNDVIGDSLKALKHFKNDLVAIRIDTPKNVQDKMFNSSENEYGVTPLMITRVRKALDEHNGKEIKIIISSGLDANRIKVFEKANSPVDIYGVGASLLKINHYFTADAVKLNGEKIAKVSRKYRINKKLMSF